MKDSEIIGFGIRNPRRGRDQIIPNVHTAELIYSLIFNHEQVDITIDSVSYRLPGYSVCVWDVSKKVFYGSPGKDWSISWLQFKPGYINELAEAYEIPFNQPISFFDDAIVERYFVAVRDEFSLYEHPDPDILRNTINTVMLETRRMLKEPENSRTMVPDSFQKVEQYIQMNYNRNITLGLLSKLVGLEPSYLSRRYKEIFGVAPIAHMIKLRLEEAIYFLKNTDLRIAEIADRVGYHDIFHFSKLFKRHYKLSPEAYRRAFFNGDADV